MNDSKKSGLVISKGEDDKIYLWAIDEKILKDNTSKNLVQYEQSSWSCVIYCWGRIIMYNSSLVFTADEMEQVKKMAEADGKWIDWVGMTFRDWGDVWRDWLKTNKNVDMSYDRVFYWTDAYNERKAKWYANVVGWYMTNEYIEDFRNDWEIDRIYSFDEKKKYWHAWSEQEQFRYTDNYPKRFAYNSYNNKKFGQFIDNDYFFGTAYFAFIDEPLIDKYANMWEYEKQFRSKYGKGTVYSDIDGALEKLDIDREYFFFNLIGLERKI